LSYQYISPVSSPSILSQQIPQYQYLQQPQQQQQHTPQQPIPLSNSTNTISNRTLAVHKPATTFTPVFTVATTNTNNVPSYYQVCQYNTANYQQQQQTPSNQQTNDQIYSLNDSKVMYRNNLQYKLSANLTDTNSGSKEVYTLYQPNNGLNTNTTKTYLPITTANTSVVNTSKYYIPVANTSGYYTMSSTCQSKQDLWSNANCHYQQANNAYI
jgi:hypothetical protein